MNSVTKWTKYLTVMSILLLTACATESSKTGSVAIVTTKLHTYSQGFQTKAAHELANLGPACDRTTVTDGCSAVKRLSIDFGTTRNKTRSLEPPIEKDRK